MARAAWLSMVLSAIRAAFYATSDINLWSSTGACGTGSFSRTIPVVSVEDSLYRMK